MKSLIVAGKAGKTVAQRKLNASRHLVKGLTL